MASEEMRAMADMLRESGLFSGSEINVAEMRENMVSMTAPMADHVTRKDFNVDGIPLCHITVAGVREDRGLLYLHGGGYMLGSLDTHAELMGRLAEACRAPVLGVDYRLAPENPYPAAVEDAVASYDRLLANGIRPDQVVIAGDSAGGGLTLACLLALKAQGKPQPAGAVLLSPWTDLTGSGESSRSRAALDPMISAENLLPTAKLYIGDTDPADPGVSPLFGDLTGLPPLLIQVGDHEVLLDDSTRLAERAVAQGVTAELEIYEEAFHVFQAMPGLPESGDALASIGRFFDRVTGVKEKHK
ncbi:MAG: alpha/beta hydrolase [Pseudomonadales bacterium]|nr:alpha/beta hydrolase [Pseudomonadales bacterium]